MWRNDKETQWIRKPVAAAVVAVCLGSAMWMSAQAEDVPAFMQNMDTEEASAEPDARLDSGPGPDEAGRVLADPSSEREGGPSEGATLDPGVSAERNVPEMETASGPGAEPGPVRDAVPGPAHPAQPFMPPPVAAEEPESPVEMTRSEREYLDELRSLQQESELWELRNRVGEQRQAYMERQQKINEATRPPEPRGPSMDEIMAMMESPSGPARNQPAPGRVASAYDSTILDDERALAEMRLVSVFGDRAQPSAEVFYGGGRMTVSHGDMLPGDWMVSEIELTRVVAEKEGRRFEIGLKRPSQEEGSNRRR